MGHAPLPLPRVRRLLLTLLKIGANTLPAKKLPLLRKNVIFIVSETLKMEISRTWEGQFSLPSRPAAGRLEYRTEDPSPDQNTSERGIAAALAQSNG